MHFSNALVLLAAVAPAVRGFKFTGPEIVDGKYKFDAPIEFKWESDDKNEDAKHPWLAVTFQTGSGAFVLTSERLDTSKNSSWEWDAVAFYKTIVDNKQKLASGPVNYFLGQFFEDQAVNFSRTADVSIETDKFEIPDYPHLVSGAMGSAPSLGLGLAIAIAAGLTAVGF